jgi:hypothetical protein
LVVDVELRGTMLFASRWGDTGRKQGSRICAIDLLDTDRPFEEDSRDKGTLVFFKASE